jgi:NADH/NAD ratio-sensing transcriptional regulator Rex
MLNLLLGVARVPDHIKVKSVDLIVSLESISLYLARNEGVDP